MFRWLKHRCLWNLLQGALWETDQNPNCFWKTNWKQTCYQQDYLRWRDFPWRKMAWKPSLLRFSLTNLVLHGLKHRNPFSLIRPFLHEASVFFFPLILKFHKRKKGRRGNERFLFVWAGKKNIRQKNKNKKLKSGVRDRRQQS